MFQGCFAFILFLLAPVVFASPFGAASCQTDARLECGQAGKHPQWSEIKKSPEKLDVLKRINRVNVGLSGKIAYPKPEVGFDLKALAPFPERMPVGFHKLLMVDLDRLAWGAYDQNGVLLRWGPIAPGKSFCPDEGKSCKTVTGEFAVYNKQGAGCKSGKYPKPNGGAPMPFCTFFHGGFAVHAGNLPGRPDSHGCVRTYYEDAKWLNQEFLEIGTRVYVTGEENGKPA